jgi:hypothetical protein
MAWVFERWLPGLNETANYELPIPFKSTPQPPPVLFAHHIGS